MQVFRKPQASRSARVLVVVLVVIVVLGLLSITLPDRIVGPVISTVKPLWELRMRISDWAEIRFTSLENAETLAQKNIDLNKKLALFALRLADRDALSKENEEILSLFGRDTMRELVLGSILTRPSVTPYDTFIVDVGKDKGIEVGDIVFAGENIVIGFVDSVFSTSARIQLFSSPGVVTEVFLSSNSIPLTLTGSGGGNFRTRIPEEVDTPIGDSAVLPGVGGLVLGTIAAVERAQNDTNKTLLLRTPANTSTLRFVFIEIGK